MIKQRELDPQEIQSKIDKNIYFRYNSVNLVIGKRGSGKTYTTLREILKLSLTNHKEYTQLHYITDKVRDDTVDKFKDIFSKSNIWFNWVPVTNAEKLITTLAKAKALKKAGETEENYHALCKALSSNPLGETDEDDETLTMDGLPHTLVIFDDCIGLFSKNTSLARKLFENRQSRITYFLLLQDVQSFSVITTKIQVKKFLLLPISLLYRGYGTVDLLAWVTSPFDSTPIFGHNTL